MKKIANDVYLIQLFPRHTVNAYLIGDVLIDAGIRSSGKRILRELNGRKLSAHAITHAHADHQGASAFLCETLGIPYWCSEGDKEVAESGKIVETYPASGSFIARFQDRFWVGPGYPVDQTLKEGDKVGEFEVLETPGHSKGHIVFWRESDRVLIAGDVINNMNMMTSIPGLQEPPDIFTPDVEENRRSIKKIAKLEPRVVCVGHGPPLYDTEKLIRFAQQF
jgi:glyoxylase-like metal-dependent hydrolase (beta-lactamase superfamily II)